MSKLGKVNKIKEGRKTSEVNKVKVKYISKVSKK